MAATKHSALFGGTTEHRNQTGPEPESVVHQLARQMQVPIAVVAEIYEFEFGKLNADARVTAFVSIIAVKRVRDALRQRGATTLDVADVDHRSLKTLAASPPTEAATEKRARVRRFLPTGVRQLAQLP